MTSHRHLWGIVAMLGMLYALMFINQPVSIDGEATLAVAHNLIQHGTPTIENIGASENLLPAMSRMGTWGVDGALYSKKGITPSLLLLPFAGMANLSQDWNVRAMAMLYNPLVTLLTALMLYVTASHLGTSSRLAYWGALLYGGATMALAYTQSVFGEPLAGFLLLSALYACLRYQANERFLWLIGAGLMLGASVGVNYSYALLIPIYALAITGADWRRWRAFIALSAPVVLWGVALLAYNALRYGDAFTSGYNFDEGEGFNYPVWWGVFGMWLSPYRGIFWYNPILLGLPVVMRHLWREHRILLFWVMALCAVQTLTYAAWWSWHGGIVWGARFLIPVLPLLMLLLLVGIRELTPRWRGALIGLGVLSFGVQMLGALIAFQDYYAFLYGNYGTFKPEGLVGGLEDVVMFSPALSPIVGHLGLLLSGESTLQIAWAQNADFLHLVFAVLLGGVGMLAVYRPRLKLISLPVMLALTLAIVARQHQAPSLTRAINADLEADVVVVAEQTVGNALLDVRGPYVVNTNAPTSPDDDFTGRLWRRALNVAQGQTLALVTWFAPADVLNWQEGDLWRDYTYIDSTPLFDDGQLIHRAVRFRLHSPVPDTSLEALWGDGIRLDAYHLERDSGGVMLALAWERVGAIDFDYSFFVHVLDEEGEIIAQQDLQPQGGYAPVTQWQADEIIITRLYFPLANPALAVRIRLGWVDWRDGSRLGLSARCCTENEALLIDHFLVE